MSPCSYVIIYLEDYYSYYNENKDKAKIKHNKQKYL